MSVTFPTKYPSALTNAAWQTQKKVTDKAGKTGLGPALDAAQAAWKKIPFTILDAKTAKAKTVAEAKANLDKAKLAKKTEVKAALDAVVAAMQKAQSVSKKVLLSDQARKGAGKIAAGLDTLQGYLLQLNLDDLKNEPDRLAAAIVGDLALRNPELRTLRGGRMADGASAVREHPSEDVVIKGLVWQTSAGNPKKLVNTKLRVDATQPDGSVFRNDMILETLSSDSKEARLKAP